MSTAEMLSEIKDDLKAIKRKLDIVTRLEERVDYHHETLGRFGNTIDTNVTDLNNIKIALAGNKTSTVDIQALIKWFSAIATAFIIAAYLSNHNVKAAIPNKDKVKVELKVEHKGKEKWH